ncbi:MAG TPA: NADH-quinone oxidoreductase subunit M [Niabella sp.]|jgi:NADH-quinone oxidoreductase subunit M|nr:NADH-quinone oxidoreductase subunit M [Chitinophagaceae bacterium]HRN46870.1 NADH-quinone oxidoreductase subunit M [Niabella sp.]HRO84623.1 NADH-quinone oxidoreductase subunit M [Niabella sp.]
MNLSLLIIIPTIFSLLLLFVNGLKQVRTVSLIAALLQFAMSIYLIVKYFAERAVNKAPFLFEQHYEWFKTPNINYHVGVDGVSVAMIALTAFVILAGVLVSWKMEKLNKEFFFLLLFLSIGAYGFFISLDLFTMFFFLEVAVIPKFILIGIWGSGRKEYSAMKLILMLMAGSALIFVGLAGLYFNTSGNGSFDMLKIASDNISPELQRLFFPFVFIGFGIFTALFPFHTWVPDGHSSAPTAASMFLAGISMKLGGYGCLRAATYMMPEGAAFYSDAIIILACIGILYGAFATMMQTDLKYINAYSSVSHNGFVLLGIGLLTKTAITGAVLQMISHGLMTALFFAVIGMIYDRTHTREVAKMSGLLKITPFISSAFVIVGLVSLGLPGFSGFVAEMTVFMGGWQKGNMFYYVATIAACASIVVTAVYILRVIGSVIMGPLKVNGNEQVVYADATWYEKSSIVLLMAGILVVGILPFAVLRLIS